MSGPGANAAGWRESLGRDRARWRPVTKGTQWLAC